MKKFIKYKTWKELKESGWPENTTFEVFELSEEETKKYSPTEIPAEEVNKSEERLIPMIFSNEPYRELTLDDISLNIEQTNKLIKKLGGKTINPFKNKHLNYKG